MAQNLSTRDLGMLPGMQARFRRVARQLPCNAADLKSHRAWCRKVGARLKSLTGYDTMVQCETRPKVTDVVDCGDYIIVINAEKIRVTGRKRRPTWPPGERKSWTGYGALQSDRA